MYVIWVGDGQAGVPSVGEICARQIGDLIGRRVVSPRRGGETVYEGESQSSEPGSMTPQGPPPMAPAPAPSPSAPPPAQSHGRANAALVAAVIALAIALIGIIAFPGPEGPEGAQGVEGAEGDEGPEGDEGADGADGADGSTGPQGPQGADGPVGPQGPVGPGALMSYANITSTVDLVDCTNVNQVTITVPQAGKVVVYATAYMKVDHTVGQVDGLRMVVDTDPTACTFGPNHWQHDIPSSYPSDTWNRMTPMLFNVFDVNGAGTYTFYLNARMYYGEGAGDQHRSSNMFAVFYPS